jgi:predicted methyltransferase
MRIEGCKLQTDGSLFHYGIAKPDTLRRGNNFQVRVAQLRISDIDFNQTTELEFNNFKLNRFKLTECY